MQMVKRIVGGFFLSLILLWLFAPKVEIYYLLEKALKEKNILISNENITDTWYGLKIENADVYVAGAKVANIAELNFNFFLFYNTLKINEIKMDKSLSNMAPKEINTLSAVYSVLNPLKVKLDGVGSFGVLEGKVALLEKKIAILFPVAKELKTIKKFLKKDKEKGWLYETNY
jgi:galactitol-specific phosphotransferase system IIB component